MIIAIRKEPNGSLYIDKDIYSRTKEVCNGSGGIEVVPVFTEVELAQPPYNYIKVEVDDKYLDCQARDFDDDLTFNVDKYNARIIEKNNQLRINEIKPRLERLSQDLIQAQAGAVFEDMESRKLEFRSLHNELRQLMGKEPRIYI